VNIILPAGEQRQSTGAAERIVVGMGSEEENRFFLQLFELYRLRWQECGGR
jgi:hypothetical protein